MACMFNGLKDLYAVSRDFERIQTSVIPCHGDGQVLRIFNVTR